ncbi:MAG TPA: DUF1801 domain-containing protein [Candidatus Eisenbacteria bacterium]|nr:DUF1801 domain-containing protein [Candidatus Eisenbacteria bacterium]
MKGKKRVSKRTVRKPARKAAASSGDWRAAVLRRVRDLILEADRDITEEVKWRKPSNPAGVPVWSRNGMICTGETYKNAVKVTFAKGAHLEDPAGLFNSGLEGNLRRAIDLHEGDEIDESGFQDLIRSAVSLNQESAKAGQKAGTKRARKPVLLSGGNPQIGKAAGNAPVQAYIAAMPGWKREVGERLDALITRHVPHVRKAVKWNSPFYGIEGNGWFVSFHVFARYVKVTFFKGTSLRPVPPGGKAKEARWIDVHEDDLDERQMTLWVKQAAAIPGWGNA